jgi:two-component system sensor histidine kinase YesM
LGIFFLAIALATGELDSTILLVESIAQDIQNEPDLQTAMREKTEVVDYDERISTLQVNTTLSLIQSYIKSDIYGIYCIGENSRQFKSNLLSMPYDIPQNFIWYKEIYTGNIEKWYPPHIGSFIAMTPGSSFISYGAPFKDKLTGTNNGVILVELRLEVFDDIFKDISSTEVNEYFILDQQNNIITSSSKDASQIGQAPIIEGLSYEQELSNGWHIMCIISERNIMKEVQQTLTLSTIIVIAIAIACSAWFSIRLSRRVSDPIDILMKQMEEIEKGNFDVEIDDIGSNYEMRNLRRSFNAMAKNCRRFLEQIRTDQMNLRKAQFAALQAQIKPHFLYNTLDMIAWNIRVGNKKSAIDAILSLTKFFRSSLSNGKDIVTLKEEIEHVTLYLQIQKLRYMDTLQFSVKFDDKLSDYIIPKLLLQPLAENAIYHGIKNKDAPGNITINVTNANNHIKMSVHDDGVGMDEQQVKSLNDKSFPFDSSILRSAEGGYGIRNVRERLQIYFGKSYRLYYESVPEKYTCVNMYIPKLLSENGVEELILRKEPENDPSSADS